MKILVACEESQVVTMAFREKGHEAYSCDIQDCSGGHPEWHIKGDCLQVVYHNKWDLLIAHPPCTYLSNVGARWLYKGGEGKIDGLRYAKGLDAKNFFMALWLAPIDKIAVENPYPSKAFNLPNHSQEIQPYYFGHRYSKKTLLWLKNLPPLMATDLVDKVEPFCPSNAGGKKRGQKYSLGVAKTAKERSKTFKGIAKAMAEQWG